MGSLLTHNDVLDRKTFENASEDELEELSVPDQVLGFLAAHSDRAFKAREIASQVELEEEQSVLPFATEGSCSR